MADVAGLRQRYPDLVCNVDPVLLEIAIADATQDVGKSEWRGFADRAIYLLAAHYLATNPAVRGDSDGGAISIRKVNVPGLIDVTYEDALDRSDYWNLSPYGIQFKQLRRRVIHRFMLAN